MRLYPCRARVIRTLTWRCTELLLHEANHFLEPYPSCRDKEDYGNEPLRLAMRLYNLMNSRSTLPGITSCLLIWRSLFLDLTRREIYSCNSTLEEGRHAVWD
jgi:hypothetical protein